MPALQTIVIVGASLAGAKAAESLREQGFDGRVVLIGEEAERPYERPPLSKEYLRGEADGPPFVHAEDFYSQHQVELRGSTRVEAIEPSTGEVVLADSTRLAYDRLLLATGAAPRQLSIPGADLEGVRYLRTLEDSSSLSERLRPGARVVVVGAGWIGSEVAASARQLGCEVTLLEMGSVPLERVLGSEVGRVYRDLHEERGVRFLGGTGAEAIEGDGSVASVRTSGDEQIPADLVIVGIGAAPRTELAEAAGIATENGILVDASLETSVPGIFAAGDVANAIHPFYGERVRVEHWANAAAQGEAAARSLLGHDVSYGEIPYFFSDQYDVGMEYSGHATSWDEVVFRGDPAGHELIAFWLREGRVLAGMNVNVWDVNDQIRALIHSRRQVDPRALADEEVSLEELASDEYGAPGGRGSS